MLRSIPFCYIKLEFPLLSRCVFLMFREIRDSLSRTAHFCLQSFSCEQRSNGTVQWMRNNTRRIDGSVSHFLGFSSVLANIFHAAFLLPTSSFRLSFLTLLTRYRIMHLSLSALVVLSGFAAVQVLAQGPTINSPPQLIQCQPSLLAFEGGVPPYFLVRPSASSKRDFANVTQLRTERSAGQSALRRADRESPESACARNVHLDSFSSRWNARHSPNSRFRRCDRLFGCCVRSPWHYVCLVSSGDPIIEIRND